MAYTSSNLKMIAPLGFESAGQMWLYRSSDDAVTVAVTGYFAGAGAGSRIRSSDAAREKGVKLSDIVINQESSGGTIPGRISWHGVIGSTANQASTAASTGWMTEYNVSVSAHAST